MPEFIKNISWGNISDIIVAITSVINIAIIIWFFRIEKKDRIMQTQANNKIFWFQKIILENNFEAVENYFKKCVELLGEIKNLKKSAVTAEEYENTIKKIIDNYNDLKSGLIKSFVDLLEILDKPFSEKILETLRNFQDEITESIAKIQINEKNDLIIQLEKTIFKHKKILLKEIYEFNKNFS